MTQVDEIRISDFITTIKPGIVVYWEHFIATAGISEPACL